MKTRTILSIIAVLFVMINCFAQTVNKRTITINGLTLNASYTSDQFTYIMGPPYSRTIEVDDGGEIITMIYSNNKFYLQANVFNCFQLNNNSYKLNGVIGVGDPIENIDLLDPFNVRTDKDKDGNPIYLVYITDYFDDMSPIYFYTESGVITKISYLFMDNT